MKKSLIGIPLIIILLLINPFLNSAPKITLKIQPPADPLFTINTTSLTGGAGTDTGLVETTTTIKDLSISKSLGDWEMEVVMTDVSTWDPGIVLSVKRTGDGGNTTVTGGSAYLELSETNQPFFTGTGDTASITVQYMIDAGLISNGLSADTYTATITYTVTDIP